MPSFSRELTIPGNISDLPDILAFIETACEQSGVRSALWFDLQLAVEEACANVFEHAYGGRGGELAITFEARGRDAVITLRDHGRPFAPAGVGAPDMSLPLAKRRIGGLGMHLMYQLMDEVWFDFAEGTNTLVMVKQDALVSPLPGAAVSAAEGDDA
jgi:serine/threonine-protein kinase RsbW